MDVRTRLIVGEYAFTSENPEIRVMLRQFAHAYSSALAYGDPDLARQIMGEALRIKVSQDIAVN